MNKYIAASVLSLGLAAAAQAGAFVPTQSVYITGATSVRSEIYGVLTNKLIPPSGAGVFDATFTNGLPTSTSFTIQGTWPNDGSGIANTAIIVYGGFSGSATGIGTLVGDSSVAAPAYVDINGAALGGVPNGGKYADLGLSDVKQASTIYSASGYSTLAGQQVAVVPFVFVANDLAVSENITNITSQQFRQMAANGYQKLAEWTANNADAGTKVYLAGRSSGSGTRITVLAETGYGINTGVQQYYAATNSQGVFTAWTKFAANGGQGSGLLVYDDIALAGTGSAALGYMGLADATQDGTVLTQISYNGSPYTVANVQNGKYTLWCYENLFSNPNNNWATGTFLTPFATALKAYFDSSSDTIALNPSGMHVLRSTDGGLVQH